MPNSDLVPYFKLGSSQDGPPDSMLVREECKRLKKANKGHYARHGMIFQEDGPRVASGPPPVSSRFGAIRDDSVSPGERVIFAYCYDDGIAGGAHDRATEIIDTGWIRPSHSQECSL